LAGEPSADEVNGFEFSSREFSHVSKPGNIGPVSFEDSDAEVIYLHLPRALHPRTLKAQVQAPDPGEQAAEAHVKPPPSPPAPRT